MQYHFHVETDLGKLSNIFKATRLVTTHWGALSVLRSSSECKSTSHMHSIKRCPFLSDSVSAEIRAWDCFLHSQGLRRPGGQHASAGGLWIKLQDKFRKELFNFLIDSQTPCLCPCYSFSLKCLYSLLRTYFLLFMSPEHPVLIRLITLSFSTCSSTCHF